MMAASGQQSAPPPPGTAAKGGMRSNLLGNIQGQAVEAAKT